MNNMNWYHSLNKPFLTPIDAVFAPAWMFLYITLAVSLYFFLKSDFNEGKVFPLALFFLQLILNFLWTPLFFDQENILGALAIVVLLWLVVLIMIVSFYKVSKISAMLLIPYFLWITFATYLNFGFFILNR